MALAVTFPDMNLGAAEADFSRPADTTAYASGDLVAQSTTAGECAAMQFTLAPVRAGHIHLHRIRLRKSDASVTNASFRVHFFTSEPAFSNGDNGAFVVDNPEDYQGYIDVSTALAFASDAAGHGGALTDALEIAMDLNAASTIYAAIEARGAYTPASGETFSLQVRYKIVDKHR